tara:strand:+ start:190 stop:429 length:240 start_codon:yes stop_codon:yes gene_type:complete
MNIMLEFTKKDNTIKDIIIDDLEKHFAANWYRLMDYGRKGKKVRIFSKKEDIIDILMDFKGRDFIKSKQIKIKYKGKFN